MALQNHGLVKGLRETLEERAQLLSSVLGPNTQLKERRGKREGEGRRRERDATFPPLESDDFSSHISVKLQEDLVVVVVPQSRVQGKSLQEHLMHGNSLLESSQVLPETSSFFFRQPLFLFRTHASSSCFILVYSSLVMASSP